MGDEKIPTEGSFTLFQIGIVLLLIPWLFGIITLIKTIELSYFLESVFLIYIVFVPLVWSGHTIGKREIGIRIERMNGKEITLWTMFLRGVVGNIFYVVTFGIGILVSLLMVIFRKDQRSIHDLIAGTYVTRD